MIPGYEELYERYTHPLFRGVLASANAHAGQLNRSCGDRVEVTLVIEQGMVQKAAWTGAGCVISQATADLLMEHVLGMPVEKVHELCGNDLRELIKVSLGPVRFRCAMLSLAVVQEALKSMCAG